MVKILSIQESNHNVGTFSSTERGVGWTGHFLFLFNFHHIMQILTSNIASPHFIKHTQYTTSFTWKPETGENRRMLFLYQIEITFIRFTNTNWKEATTPWPYQHQLPSFTNTNWKETPTPQLYRHQLKEASTPQLY